MKRTTRQEAILKLIQEKSITTQSMLKDELNKLGYNATQATISRDIEQLGLVKSTQKNKKGIYVKPADAGLKKMMSLFHQSVISINGVKNFIVIKTISGGASSACIVLDKLDNPEIMGSIAGDDTVFVIIKDENQLNSVIKQLQDLLEVE